MSVTADVKDKPKDEAKPVTVASVVASVDPLAGVGAALSKAASDMVSTLVALALFVVGVALVMRNTEAVKTATGAATSAAKMVVTKGVVK